MAIDQNFYADKRNKNLLYSGSFLLFVFFFSGWLFWYNLFLEGENSNLESQIKIQEASITVLKSDKKIQVKELVDINKWALKELEKRSDVVRYIKYLKLLNSKYGINLEGFDYAWGKISTTAKISSDEGGRLAYIKLVNFIKDYRLNKDTLLDLMFVNTISGHDSIEFSANFKLK